MSKKTVSPRRVASSRPRAKKAVEGTSPAQTPSTIEVPSPGAETTPKRRRTPSAAGKAATGAPTTAASGSRTAKPPTEASPLATKAKTQGAPTKTRVASAMPRPKSAPARPRRAVGTSPAEPASRPRGLSILMVASEALPFAKTGGLGDVAGALPVAIGRAGHDVTLVVPRYRGIDVAGTGATVVAVPLGREVIEVTCHAVPLAPGARAILVDCPAMFDRDGLYGVGNDDYDDNPRRFGLLSRAALEFALATGLRPDIVHAHDWQAALVPVFLRTLYADHPVFGGVPTVFTIHNVAYKGLCDGHYWVEALGLPPEVYTVHGVEYWGRMSLLKGGITCADLLTTVSPRYAEELLTPEAGLGFEGIVASRRRDLVGILNGIDTACWDPSSDPLIPSRYSAGDLAGKEPNKRALLDAYGLPVDPVTLSRPLVGMIARMIDQKGLDLIAAAQAEFAQLDASFVVLGTGEARYEDMWRALSASAADRIAVRIGYDEQTAHLVHAGSDLFLLPSRFEPCGLSQMYAQRYGTVPVVRATGGLDDSVDHFDVASGRGTGFKFHEYSPEALLGMLKYALATYHDRDAWRLLQQNGMGRDFSWDAAARSYERAYERARQAAVAHAGM